VDLLVLWVLLHQPVQSAPWVLSVPVVRQDLRALQGLERLSDREVLALTVPWVQAVLLVPLVQPDQPDRSVPQGQWGPADQRVPTP
jgi:hypothetical protein